LLPFGFVAYQTPEAVTIYAVIALIVPLFLLYCVTFTFNYYTDQLEDRVKRLDANPIVSGKISSRTTLILVCIYTCSIIVTTCMLLRVPLSWLILFCLLAFSFLYGYGIRFKETIIGPGIASLFFWGPALVIWVELNIRFDPITILYLGSIILVGIQFELLHLVHDYELDRTANLRTVATIFGIQQTHTFIQMLRLGLFSILLVLSIMISYLLFIVTILFMILYYSNQLDWYHYYPILLLWLYLPHLNTFPMAILFIVSAGTLANFTIDALLSATRAYRIARNKCAEFRSQIHETIKFKYIRLGIR
jgi:4-hydroxybenzoate polyprenyltransferase